MTDRTFPPAAIAAFHASYPEQPHKLEHDLLGHKLFTLEALAELATRLDPAHVEYNAGDLPVGIEPDDVFP